MTRPRKFLLLLALAVAAATPGAGQGAARSAPMPDFSGKWSHPFLNGLESPRSGPGPVINKLRRLEEPQVGKSNISRPAGDYTNPILQPWAAEVVKKFGDIVLAGDGFPTPRNQCWPEQVPFVFINFGMQILQRPDKVTILYPFDHQFRQVRMNKTHPAHVSPSWYGDSVGRYEGDTLVVDTVGIKVGRFSMIDWFGTPFTETLHVVERYRLLDYDETIEALERAAKGHYKYGFELDNGSPFDPNYKGKGLQIQVTIEDKGAFTKPWSASITLRRSIDEKLEVVCPENLEWYPGKTSAVPTASK